MGSFATWLIGRRTPYIVFGLSLALTFVATAYISLVAGQGDWHAAVILLVGLAVSGALFAIARAGRSARLAAFNQLDEAQTALARHGARLRILHEIDRSVAAEESLEEIAGAVIQPLRELLEVPRAIVNMFDLAKGEVEWLAAAGRRRVHVGPGVRYPIRLMGDLEALKKGEPQVIDTRALPPGPEADALLASGIELYMAVPMIAGDELIGAISFGGPPGPFPRGQVSIAMEVATQLAIAIRQARLYERSKRHAEELEQRVQERTQELSAAHASLQKTNAELVQLAAELQAANKELESFSYSVSHDLRAPLRHVDGFSQMLLEQYRDKLDDKGQRYLGLVRASTQRMGELIDDLLQLSRVSRGELHHEQVDLSGIAGTVLGELRNAEPGRNVHFDIQDGVIVQADQRLMRVVLDNLLGNAWKFSAKTGESRIAFGISRQGSVPAYFVRDNGAGFDMTYVEKLFRPFQRLHTETEFTGTGIGLATVHRIVSRHGGRVWAEGVVNGGATFFFTLKSSLFESRRRAGEA